MGYVAHHAIVVTSWQDELLERAHGEALTAQLRPTDITPPAVNGYRSFLVPPDGSKEGWEQSEQGDHRRAVFKDWLRAQRYEDDSSPLEWAELRYGSDERAAAVSDSEWASRVEVAS